MKNKETLVWKAPAMTRLSLESTHGPAVGGNKLPAPLEGTIQRKGS